MDQYRVEGKTVDLVDEPWDFLVVLDACRYDVFKHTLPLTGLKGTVCKAISPATWTMEWLHKQFPQYYSDIIYVSATPYVNSVMKVCHKPPLNDRLCYNAKHHFYKIVDVWRDGWDERFGTVPPGQVNKAFHTTYLQHPNKRYILHYMQPHTPYLCLPETQQGNGGYHPNRFQQMVNNLCSQRMVWLMKQRLHRPATSELEGWFRQFGTRGVMRCYQHNVLEALRSIRWLVQAVKGRWLVTSDHGERIMPWVGKPHSGRRDRAVIEVPWCYCEGGNQ